MLLKTRLPFRIGFLAIFLILFALFANSASALTYTKNSFPTSSGQIITCDGSDFRISCEDSGDGRNHFCSTFGINGCRAVEGRNNYGSPGCLITCQREDRCSDGTPPGQCSATNPFYCDAGILVKRASLCGCVSPKVRSGDDCIEQASQAQQAQVQQPQVCSDNTPFNQCSSNRPLFCLSGSLINRALTCGCPSGQTPSGDNCIVIQAQLQTCSDGTFFNQCSSNRPLFCDNGNLVNRASTCNCPSGQVVSGNNCITPQQACTDGTLFGQCSPTRPLFCNNGVLINRATTCGCPSGQSASGDSCASQQAQAQVCSDGTVFNQCSANRPLFCNNGNLVNRASTCNCPSGQVASGDTCIVQQAQTCSDNTLFNQCSSNRPLFCDNGNLVNRASSCGCSSGQTANGNNCVPASAAVSAQVSNKLSITDIDAKVDGKTSSNVGNNGEISREAKPGSDIELEIEIKNIFTSAEDTDIEDVQVKASIEGIDDGSDIEEESESFDLRADSEKTVRFKFKVPLNVEEGTYNIFIEAEGEDENDIAHRDDADIDLEVEKDLHDLRLASFVLSPEEISCSMDLNANARIINLGEADENAVLEIKNDDLGLNMRSPVSIKSGIGDNSVMKNIKFAIGNSAREGTYSISANAISEDGTIRDTSSADITIASCGAASQDGVILQISTPPKTKGGEIIAPLFDFNFGGLDPKILILLLAIFIIILFVLIIIFAAASEKTRDEEQYY